MSDHEPALLSVKEAGAYLRVSRATVYNLINARKVRAVKLGRRTLLPLESLKAFTNSLPIYESSGL